MTIGSDKQIGNNDCWNRRTKLERNLLIAVSFAVFVSICFIIGLVKLTNKKSSVCLTSGCINAASEVLKYIDETVDPCDDFFEFSCGKFLRESRIPDDRTGISSSDGMYDLLQEQLKWVFEEKIKNDDIRPFVIVKKLYKACMNKTLLEKIGLSRAKGILQDLGGWPVLDGSSWNERDFDWKNIIYNLRHMGISDGLLFDIDISEDYKNNTNRVLMLDQADLGLARKLLIKGFDEKLVKAYYDFMVEIAVIFGADRGQALKELKASLEFEIKLANISIPMEDRRNSSLEYNPTTIDGLQKTYPSIPWLKFINMYLSPIISITNNETIIVRLPKFLKDLEELLRRTPKRVLANYLLWRTVYDICDYLNEEVRKKTFKFTMELTGKTEERPRWKKCVDIVSSMYIASGALYIRKYFDHKTKDKVVELVTDVQDAFRDMLKTVDWVDEKTRKRAFEKANAMAKYIGFPDELLDDNKINEYYKGLEVKEDEYLLTMLNLTIFQTEKAIKRFREPVNKTDWTIHAYPAIINAFYSFTENSIQFPAAILQGVYFNKDRPFALNYGAIGFVIGHEITHGFDDQGRQFDKDGNLKDWWEPPTEMAYLQKAQCIIDQYSNITVPEVGMNINGINTQGENIADNGGIKEAYLAYKKWIARHGEEQPLPGLKYSPKQLFWISSGISWCMKTRPERLKIMILMNYHSPEKYRVVVPLSNSEDFSKDFNCPKGSKMNPKNKCTVW